MLNANVSRETFFDFGYHAKNENMKEKRKKRMRREESARIMCERDKKMKERKKRSVPAFLDDDQKDACAR